MLENFEVISICLFGVCVCMSVTSRCSVETTERIELVFGTGASFHPYYAVLKGNSCIAENKDTSLWNCSKLRTSV